MGIQRSLSFIVLALALLSQAVTSANIVIPAEPDHVVSLNGTWRFKIEQIKAPEHYLGDRRPLPVDYPATFEPFYQADYTEDANWHDLAVPGNWEMAGFSPATYDNPDNTSGFYRHEFTVPAEWNGRDVYLNFDGVQNGCEIWCNGQPVKILSPSWGRENYHEGGYTAFQVDLTPTIKFGAKNLLALRVTKNTKSVDADTGDYFFLGGVHRPVTLFSLPRPHIHDLTVRTKLLDNNQAQLQVLLEADGDAAGTALDIQLEGFPLQHAHFDEHGKVDFTQVLDHPELWSAEHPKLYTITVDLQSADGKTIEHTTTRTGIREIEVKDGIFMINRVPVKLVGICRHDLYPTEGSAITRETWKKDLTLMKQANFNAVRTSHYPYGSGFYDLCDEMGMYVLDEEAFCWLDCDKPEDAPFFEQHTRETIARDKNHPCVVIWGVGNENKIGRNNVASSNLTQQLDPTRPCLISSVTYDAGGSHTQFDDRHYVTVDRIHKDEIDPRRKNWPEIYTENPNVWDVRNGPDYGSLDLWWMVIDRTWREIWKDDHIAGTFLWEWTDRAVADKNPEKRYYFYPETGINLLKTKGLVDAYRNPRPDLYHCKMAQTPIFIDGKPDISADGVTLHITNRFSFTDLNELPVIWQLYKGEEAIASGQVRHRELALAPRSTGDVTIHLPADKLSAADMLRMDVLHEPDSQELSKAYTIVTYQFALKPRDVPAPKVALVGGLTFPRFHFVSGKNVKDSVGWNKQDRSIGHLTKITIQTRRGASTSLDEATLAKTPLADIRSIDADVILNSSSTVGHLSAKFDGAVFSYTMKWSGPKSDASELGWEFSLPAGVDHFSWSRQAPWAYYPPDHIGRPTGTTTPDSANQQLTHITRPDAFDFNSTKFDCNWAAMTDSAKQQGLCVIFGPDERQHVRGGVSPDGSCTLIVNRKYNPPRDISSHLVPDLYTVLNPGSEVTGEFHVGASKPSAP